MVERTHKDIGRALVRASASAQAFSACSTGLNNTFSANAGRIVKDEYSRTNYENVRPSERIPKDFADILLFCNEAYYTVSIIRNVIDLMSDFCVKGIDWAHPNTQVQAFMRAWFSKVKGQDISERFCNYLLRLGGTCIVPDHAKISGEVASEWRKTRGQEFSRINARPFEIPCGYSFIDISALNEELNRTGESLDSLGTLYRLNAAGGQIPTFGNYSSTLRFQGSGGFSSGLFQNLPNSLKKQALSQNGQLYLRDGQDIFIYHYKKDDWDSWARPLIYAIAEPIIMLKKMHLADMSALDGVISNVRLWKVGYIDPKNVLNSIIPSPTILRKIGDLIKNSVSGGVLDIIWGPDLDFKESQSSAHHFLTKDKYTQVMSELYEGLGINPSLAGGGGGSSGGMTNNAIALKVMVERLNYLRSKLVDFWTMESRKIQKAMGFSSPAKIVFDDAVFSDEVAYKKLLIELYDRDVISIEAIRDEFNFLDRVESSRILKENRKRAKHRIPPKASTFHDPMWETALKTDLMKSGQLDGDEFGIDIKELPQPAGPGGSPSKPAAFSKDKGGRPTGSKDTTKRDQRTPKVRTVGENSEFVTTNVWAREALSKIGDIVGPHYLAEKSKANFRQLTDEESLEFESLKLALLVGVSPLTEITAELIEEIADDLPNCSVEATLRDVLIEELAQKVGRPLTMEDRRIASAGAYTLTKLSDS
jgi:hypothetical protein